MLLPVLSSHVWVVAFRFVVAMYCPLFTHVWVVAFRFVVACTVLPRVGGGIPFCCCLYCPPTCGWWHSLLLLPCTVHPCVGGGIPFCCCHVLSTHVWVVAFRFVVAMYCPLSTHVWVVAFRFVVACTVHPRVGGGIPFCCCHVRPTVHTHELLPCTVHPHELLPCTVHPH